MAKIKAKNLKTDSGKHHKKRRKLSLFYKISFSLLIIGFVSLFYFAVLVSTKPKSIPFVTQKINSVLAQRFGYNDVTLENSYLSFTRYGTLKISVVGLNILYSADNSSSEKQSLIIPRVETEFSLLNLLALNFQPIKIKIIRPNIIIDNLSKLSSPDQKNAENETKQNNQALLMIGILSSMQKGNNLIENFEIEDARLTVRGEKFHTEILVKKSKINTAIKNNILTISSENNLSFDAQKSDVNLNSVCQFSKNGDLKCDLFLRNFIPGSIPVFYPALSDFNKVHTAFDANISFAITDNELGSVVFKAKASKGDFEFLDFFKQKMDFSNLSIAGEYNHKIKILDLSQIEADFPSALDLTNKAHLNMSLLLSRLNDPQSKKLDFYIKLQNVLNDELEKFWPVALHEHGIREWVIQHSDGGLIKNAYAKFSITHDGTKSHLENIDSEVIFSDFNLKYGDSFPKISGLSGIASFTHEGMKISISGGDVLNSKISEGLVAIDNFSDPNVILKISGRLNGHAADGLKHASSEPKFFTEIEKYLNGNAQSDFDVRIPLSGKITLRNSYIAANSTIANLSNEYVHGGAILHTKKDFNNSDFVTNIDLTAAELGSKAFDLEKKLNIESGLDLVVSLNEAEKIHLNKISFWKKNEPEQKDQPAKKHQKESSVKAAKITGNIAFTTAPFAITLVNLKNNNFGKNDYNLFYSLDQKAELQKIVIKGQKINLESFLEQKFFTKSSGRQLRNLQIQITANQVNLLHKKFVKNFYFSASCANGICHKGLLRGRYGKKQLINLRTTKKAKDDYAVTEGRITDVGYLAEALGISNVVSGGNAQVKLWNKTFDKKPFLEGRVIVNNDITIYENPTVKRLTKDTLLSQIKDKIFSSKKTVFDSVKLEFSVDDKMLNISSLIANNYKIGITAKGKIDLKNDGYEFKGMIIPGFIINNLFGIGKIPLIGGVISGILTGGEGGGLFGIRYEYIKKNGQKESVFTTNKVSAFVPSTIQNLFE